MKVLPLCEHALRWFMIFDALVYLLQFMYTLMGTNDDFPKTPLNVINLTSGGIYLSGRVARVASSRTRG